MPLAGALTPASGAQMPLVLPAGPTASDPLRAPADVVPGTDEDDFIIDGTSIVKGKAVLLPRDGAMITQRAIAASAAGAKALVLYGDGGVPEGALGLNDRVKLPIVVIPGEQGAAAAGTLLTGGAVTRHVRDRGDGRQSRRPARSRRSPPRGWRSTTPSSPISSRPASAITSSAPGDGYMAQSGTSVAAAQVAGAAALVMQAHPTWSRASCAVRSSATARAVRGGEGDGAAPVEAQGGGSVSVAAASAATVVAEPSSISFGLARAPRVSVKRVLTLANTGKATVHVTVSLTRDGDDDGADSRSPARPRSWRSRPGDTVPVPLTLHADDLPDATSVVGGWLLVLTDGGGTCGCPGRSLASDDLAAGLIGGSSLVPAARRADDERRAGRAAHARARRGAHGRRGAARDLAGAAAERRPLSRLTADRAHLERHELLPGSYRYGITGIDPSTGKPLTPGIYRLVIDAVSSDEVTSERQLGFTVAG